MFGEKLNGTDPEDVIRNAFACFDDDNTGNINEETLRELLTTMGDRFTDDQVDDMFREAPIDRKTYDFNYIEFVKILKHGKTDPDAMKTEMVPLGEYLHNVVVTTPLRSNKKKYHTSFY